MYVLFKKISCCKMVLPTAAAYMFKMDESEILWSILLNFTIGSDNRLNATYCANFFFPLLMTLIIIMVSFQSSQPIINSATPIKIEIGRKTMALAE